MLSSLKRLIGNISVEEKGDLITIEGLPTYVLTHDIQKIWATSKVANMFSHVDRSSLSFHRFFAPDFAYALKQVLIRQEGRYHFRALKKVEDLLYQNTWLAVTLQHHEPILDWAPLKELNIDLMPHQEEFLREYDVNVPKYNLKGYYLGAAPGTGKTIMGLALSLTLHADVVVCVVPKNSVIDVWGATLEMRFRKPQKVWLSTSGTQPAEDCKYYVFHYEQLEEALAFFRMSRYRRPVVLLDESHNLNEMTSLRTKLFVELCHQLKAKHVLWASGTPIKAIGSEAVPFLFTVDEYFTEQSMLRFKGIYGKTASRAVDILRNRLGMMTFRVDKSVVVVNDVHNHEVGVTIPKGERYTLDSIREDMRAFIAERMAYYQEHMSEFVRTYELGMAFHRELHKGAHEREAFMVYESYIDQIRQGYDMSMTVQAVYCNKYELTQIIPYLPAAQKEPFKQARSVVKYYHLKVQGEALGRILGKMRAQCHVEMVRHSNLVEYIETALKKTVLFTSYIEVVHEADEFLREQGFKPLLVYGATNKDLSAIVKKFAESDDANPLIATFQSLSTAVPLVMASTAVLTNPPFRDHEWNQATSRINRLGQDSPVTFWNLHLDTGDLPNISTRSAEIMKWSKDQVEAIMGRKIGGDVEMALENFEEEFDTQISMEGQRLSDAPPAWLEW